MKMMSRVFLVLASVFPAFFAGADPTSWTKLTKVQIGDLDIFEVDAGGSKPTKYTTIEFTGKSLAYLMKLLPQVTDSETGAAVDERKIEIRSDDLKSIRISCSTGYFEAGKLVKYPKGPKCLLAIIVGPPIAD